MYSSLSTEGGGSDPWVCVCQMWCGPGCSDRGVLAHVLFFVLRRCSSLLYSPYTVLWPSICFCYGSRESRLPADDVFCQVFLGLPTGTVPSTTSLVHAFKWSASFFLPTWSSSSPSFPSLTPQLCSHRPCLTPLERTASNACRVSLALHLPIPPQKSVRSPDRTGIK